MHIEGLGRSPAEIADANHQSHDRFEIVLVTWRIGNENTSVASADVFFWFSLVPHTTVLTAHLCLWWRSIAAHHVYTLHLHFPFSSSLHEIMRGMDCIVG